MGLCGRGRALAATPSPRHCFARVLARRRSVLGFQREPCNRTPGRGNATSWACASAWGSYDPQIPWDRESSLCTKPFFPLPPPRFSPVFPMFPPVFPCFPHVFPMFFLCFFLPFRLVPPPPPPLLLFSLSFSFVLFHSQSYSQRITGNSGPCIRRV